MEHKVGKVLTKKAYIPGIVGIIATLLIAVAVIYFWEFVQTLGGYGYLGAFLISILGGATIIVPVPVLAVVFALGGVMKYPVLVGVAAGLGESLGGLAIYMTGYGGGTALINIKHSKIQAVYSRILRWMERRGSWTLFVASAVLFSPFFYPASLAAGALRFGIYRYFLICLAGKTVKGMTVAFAGYWGLRALLRMLGIPI